VGQALVLCALAALTYAVIEGPHEGWGSGRIAGLLGAAGAALVALLQYEPRQVEPLLELCFFRSVPFSSATLIAVLAFGSFSGFLFLNTLYLQEVRGLPALQSGLCTLPLALATVVCSPISGWLIGRSGTRLPLMLAGACLGASALLLARLDAATPLAQVLAAYVVFGLGFGLINAPITNTAVSGMPRTRAGLAAAIASTSRQVGASLGVAVGGTIAQSRGAGALEFVRATHPFFELVVGGGLVIMALGWLSNSEWSQATLRRAAALIEEAEASRGTTR
jgi:predicted MFS family arabinose efflux permease